MLSHFTADACMPCHCDKRYLASYDGHLHPEWEAVMSKPLLPVFDLVCRGGSRTAPLDLLTAARENDSALGVVFNKPVPVIKDGDVWKETVAMCRASYAVNNILAAPADFPPGSRKTFSTKDLLASPKGTLFKTATSAALHDAVMNTATIWKHVWRRFTPAK